MTEQLQDYLIVIMAFSVTAFVNSLLVLYLLGKLTAIMENKS